MTLTGPVQAKLMELFPFPYLMAAVNVWQPIKVFITVFKFKKVLHVFKKVSVLLAYKVFISKVS